MQIPISFQDRSLSASPPIILRGAYRGNRPSSLTLKRGQDKNIEKERPWEWGYRGYKAMRNGRVSQSGLR